MRRAVGDLVLAGLVLVLGGIAILAVYRGLELEDELLAAKAKARTYELQYEVMRAQSQRQGWYCEGFRDGLKAGGPRI